ncbi:MAG: protein TonB [Rickettsiales bacterium]|jgi:protein TonB
MLKRIIETNIPWLSSIFIHLFLLFLLSNLNSLPKVRQKEFSVAINLISMPEPQKVSSKNIINDKVVKFDQKPETKKEIQKSDYLGKKLNKIPEKVISDLSYSHHTYKIGSEQNPIPPYPRIAKLRNYQGNVEVSVLSDFQGDVVDAKIHKSSGYPILDKSALVTLKKWSFDIKDSLINKNRYYRIIVPINFILG